MYALFSLPTLSSVWKWVCTNNINICSKINTRVGIFFKTLKFPILPCLAYFFQTLFHLFGACLSALKPLSFSKYVYLFSVSSFIFCLEVITHTLNYYHGIHAFFLVPKKFPCKYLVMLFPHSKNLYLIVTPIVVNTSAFLE